MENIEEQTRRRPRADLDDILAIIGCSSTAAGSSIPTTLPAAHDELRIAGDEGERSRKRPKQTTNRQRQLGKYLPCVFRVIAQLMRQLDALARELGLDDELAQGDVQAAGQLLSNTVRMRSTPHTSIPPKVRLEQSSCGSRGVFVRPGATVECGEVVAEYSGETFWVEENKDAEISGRGKYVFFLGPMHVPETGGDQPRRWSVAIDAADTRAEGWNVAHMINTSHPRLVPPWNTSNCVFCVYIDELRLAVSEQPRIRLFAQATQQISRPPRAASGQLDDYELRLDYHWQLAHEAGLWCLDTNCDFCIESLHDFAVRRPVVDNGILEVTVAKRPIVCEFIPAEEATIAPWPRYEDMEEREFMSKLAVVNIEGDGNCQFRALAAGIYEHQGHWRRLKEKLLEWCGKYRKDVKKIARGRQSTGSIMEILSADAAWGTDTTMDLAQACFNVAVYVWLPPRPECSRYSVGAIPFEGTTQPRKVMHVLYVNSNHYQLLTPNSMYVPPGSTRPRKLLRELDEQSAAESPDWPESSEFQSPTTCRPGSARSAATISNESLTTCSTPFSCGSRPSNEEYSRKINSDIMADLQRQLGLDSPCCQRRCLYLTTSSQSQFPVHTTGRFKVGSAVVDHALEVVTNTRDFIARSSQHERGRFVREIIANGRLQTSEGGIQYHYLLEYLDGEDLQRKEICEHAFMAFYGISRSMIHRAKSELQGASHRVSSDIANNRHEVGCAHGREFTEDSSTRQLTHEEHECVAFIRGFCESNGEKMPHKPETRISFRKRHVFHEYRQQCEARNRSTFGKSKFYQLWSEHCADITTARWKGDFAICDKCKEFSQTTSNPLLTEREREDARRRQQEHLATILQCKKGYYARQYKAADREEQYMSIILDACDSNTTLLPNIASRSKSEQSHGAAFLKHKLMAARVHGRRNRDYLYLMPPFAAKTVGCNLTLEALVRTLNFEADRRIQQNLAWPRTLYLQLDNTSKDNKNKTVFAFLSYLVQTEVFDEAFVNFLPVGHTHEDIDQLFSVLTNRLRFNDAYTFEQWRAEMFAAFSNEPDKIMRVEYVWVLHDFREWLKPFAEKPYHGFRSGCFHFKIYRRNGQAVMSYMKYDFHASVPDGGYWPRNTEPKCWLPVLPPDLPQIDPTHGGWPVDPSGPSTVHDAESYIKELTALLSLPTNRAAPEDIETWRTWLHRIPKPGNTVGSDLYPSFTLPNRRAINASLGNAAHYVDIDLASVGPERPVDYDILLHQGQTKTQRERLKKVQEEARHIRPLLQANCGDFVVYLVDLENEMMLADTQRGLSRESLSLPFSLGQVKGDAPAESDTLEVFVYYTKHGDPNEPWNAWIHEGRGQNHWSTHIPKSSVVLVNPTFRKQAGTKQKTLTADAKGRLATVPGFPYTFVRGKGFIPWEKVSATLSQEMDDIPRAPSKANLRRKKRLESTLRHQESMHHTLQQAQKRISIETGANTDRP